MVTSTRTWGASRKAGALIGLVLAIAVLNPASAPADAGGTDRPIKGAGMGTISIHPATGTFTGDVPGVSSHLGAITVHIEGVGAPVADGTFAGTGTATIVAANGEEVTGTITVTQAALADGHTTTTVVVRITGGTGRFADASGTLTVVCESGPPSLVGATLVINDVCAFRGLISY
jgi:hypothetical protein